MNNAIRVEYLHVSELIESFMDIELSWILWNMSLWFRISEKQILANDIHVKAITWFSSYDHGQLNNVIEFMISMIWC